MRDHQNIASDDANLETLHERVNAMLDIPTPKESDAFPLPVEATLDSMTGSDTSAPSDSGH